MEIDMKKATKEFLQSIEAVSLAGAMITRECWCDTYRRYVRAQYKVKTKLTDGEIAKLISQCSNIHWYHWTGSRDGSPAGVDYIVGAVPAVWRKYHQHTVVSAPGGDNDG